ncbi:AAA family ATPase [Aspergillus piperis CBS 112811]|uniref:AAA family ATPase n=1 Tax=Aspergillus piperis CBS 112811 TaxID=1448313 RepID=A0A8G1VNJ0_9EURO|nr:AAA family ATPase [Aspergillus piperis CBS 112811]RAH59929.1 AAA family ATPase [Aspergillus piperis CBS 112811]
MRFAKDSEAMMKSLRDQGSQFQNFVRERHLYYDGWTLVHGPTGDPDSEHRIASEHIDGDVIIDFLEGYKAESSLRSPSFDGLDSFDDSDWPVGDDELYIKHWINGSRSKLLGEITEITQRGEWFGGWLTKRRLKEDRFLNAWEAGTMRQLGGDDLALLPRRVIAYAFRERKFVMVDIRGLKKKDPAPQNVFKDLKIDPDHKRMVRSLVKTHFARQEIQKHQPNASLNQDLIRGKGSGLVILLHGVPGVGKTATAEAVAQANNKPLFVITCGDLGFTPKEVDASLKDIFRLAHLWDCVLLLDEADVFLSRREVSDLKRNALVSVFLRVLEYYSGILFLTTNRVGTLDEAFKSRIHVSLYYPPLDKDQTLAIFDLNIRKLNDIQRAKQMLQVDGDSSALREPELAINRASIMDYANWHYDTHEQYERWNGRQIRNAFQIAYSLAHYEMERDSQDQWDEDVEPNIKKASNGPQATRTLDYRQFVSVAKTIERFDDYLYDAIACTDMDNARDNGLRADDHDPNMNHRPDYHTIRHDPVHLGVGTAAKVWRSGLDIQVPPDQIINLQRRIQIYNQNSDQGTQRCSRG